MLENVKGLCGIYNMDKLKLIKLKLIAQQAIMWYGLLINGPMIAYIFYKTSEVKWIAGVCLLCGFGLISMISILWYKYFLSEGSVKLTVVLRPRIACQKSVARLFKREGCKANYFY